MLEELLDVGKELPGLGDVGVAALGLPELQVGRAAAIQGQDERGPQAQALSAVGNGGLQLVDRKAPQHRPA